jgi:lipopolysaccharide assembly protein A
MRQFIGFVVFVPLAVVVGIFAVENRAPLSLEIWPLPGVHQMWASVWILGLLAIGVVVGMVIGWMAGTGARRRARRAERTNRMLERQIADRESQAPTTPAEASSGALPAPENQAARIAQRED